MFHKAFIISIITFLVGLVYWTELTTWIVIFITRNKMCYNIITKSIHKFDGEL